VILEPTTEGDSGTEEGEVAREAVSEIVEVLDIALDDRSRCLPYLEERNERA
jgi:hypothetical protein